MTYMLSLPLERKKSEIRSRVMSPGVFTGKVMLFSPSPRGKASGA